MMVNFDNVNVPDWVEKSIEYIQKNLFKFVVTDYNMYGLSEISLTLQACEHDIITLENWDNSRIFITKHGKQIGEFKI